MANGIETTLKDIFDSTSLSFSTTLTYADIIIGLLITFGITLFIHYIYKKTYSGVLYSKDFALVLILVSMVSTAIMMGISRNLALSLGLIGALSIVRFRSAIKDPKDVAYLFWAISVGIVNGVQFYMLSVITAIVVGITMILLSKKFTTAELYILIIKYDALNKISLENVFKKFCAKYKLRNISLNDDGGEQVVEVKLKRDTHDEMLVEIRKLHGVREVTLFSHEGELTD